MGIIRATNANVDLRGGIIEVHRLPGYSFGPRGVVAYAKTFNYDQGAMINAFIEEGASYYVMHVDKDTEDFIYAEVLRFTSAPESL
ncbi:MAG: hypothetical protein KBS96_00045 [Lachnospiraceae bacterium]|nr:hypothetical protein [Candidatus Colinaster scatohippi]